MRRLPRSLLPRLLPRLLVAGPIAVIAAVALPVAASAHALLISTNPVAGAHLGTAPGVVVLEFSQTLNPRLSSASVRDPTDRRWAGLVDSAQEMRVPLATNAAGVYTVDWVSVSVVDGHVISGTFTFDAGVAGAGSTGGVVGTPGPQAGDLAIGAVKWVEAAALLLLGGQAMVARLGRRDPPLDWVRPRFQAASVALSAGLVVVWAEATLASGGHSIGGYLAFFGSGLSGAALLSRLGLETLLLLAVVRGWRSLPLWIAGALVALAASGHAAGADPAWLGVGLDAAHLLAAAVWAGGIAALAGLRPPRGWRSAEARLLLGRFTPVALATFAVTVTAGALEAVLQLGSLQSLLETAYGRVLLAKMALVALMLPLSIMAWRLSRPHLRVEAAVAGGVVAAAALLAAFPAPPTAAARQAALAAAATPGAGLPAPDELTMAGSAGSVLVGLSLSPGTPGANRADVYLLPITGSAAAAALPANIVVAGRAHALQRCGDTCRRASVSLRGGETVLIDVLGPGGGEASFALPPLPAPPGVALLAQSVAAMHGLTSYQATEVLDSGTTTIASRYASVAPDRSTWTVGGRAQTVWIGTTQYTRDGPGQSWREQTGLPVNSVPYYVWDYFQPLTNAHVIGHGVQGGVPTTEVATFGNREATAIWFTFWIDGRGLVRRVSMDAPGHFMTDTYVGYNTPLTIVAPAASP